MFRGEHSCRHSYFYRVNQATSSDLCWYVQKYLMKLVYPIRTGLFEKWISIAVKPFDTGLAINESLLVLNSLCNLLKYAGMAIIKVFNN